MELSTADEIEELIIVDHEREPQVSAKFVALLPAFDDGELEQAVGMTKRLLELGCVELVCVGPRSEELHDSLDVVVEEMDMSAVLTNWHADAREGCWYFLYASGAGEAEQFVAFVAARPELIAMLDEV
jgi:hypothetical protein